MIDSAILTSLVIDPSARLAELRLRAPAEGAPDGPLREWRLLLRGVSRVAAWLRQVDYDPDTQLAVDHHPAEPLHDLDHLNDWLGQWSGQALAGQPEPVLDAEPPEWLRWASLNLVAPSDAGEIRSLDLWLADNAQVGPMAVDVRVEFAELEVAAPAAAGRTPAGEAPEPGGRGRGRADGYAAAIAALNARNDAYDREYGGGDNVPPEDGRWEEDAPERARRARFVAVAAVLVLVAGGAWFAVKPGGTPPRHGAAHHPAGKPASGPSGLAAAESGLLPWHLGAPLSREVVTAGPSGRLLVFGGLTTGGVSANGIYSVRASTGAARRVGALPAPLHDAAGAVVGNQALVFGGGSSATVATVEGFPAAGGGGRQARATGSMPAPRSDALAAVIGSTAYVVGGYTGSQPDSPVLATTDGRTFTKVASLPVPVRYPAVAALGGQIYVFGGQAVTGSGAGAPVDVIQAVNPVRHTASVVGHLPEPLAGAAAMTVNGELFVAGGESTVRQHVVAGAGTTQLPASETAPGGSEASAGSPTHTVSTIWAFDPATARLLPAGVLQVPVSHAAVAVTGSTAWIVGGESHGALVAAVQMLRPNRKFGIAGVPGAGSPYFGAKLLIADRGNNRILLFDDTMHLVWKYPSAKAPRDPLRFYFPDDAFFIDHGTAILSNQEQNETIIKLAYPSGKIFWSYGHPGKQGTAPGYLYEPDDAYLLKNGQITVADANNCRVLVINPNGTVAHQIGTNGVCVHHPPTELGNPNGDTPLANGDLLISEINGSWVSEYTMTGKLVWTTTLPIGYPSDPQQLGPDLYLIADYSTRGGILEFNRKGRVLYHYHPASGPGMLDHPSLTELLPSGAFMVNDDYNNRMVAIDPATKAIVWQYGVTGRHGRSYGKLHTPDGFDLLLPNGTTPTHPFTG